MDTADQLQAVEQGSMSKQAIYIAALDETLLPTIAEFIGDGIKQGDLCFAIATPKHLKSLNKILRAKNIDLQTATEAEQYFTFDAKWVMAMMDAGKTFDLHLYRKTIEKLSNIAANRQQGVRAFGEVVTL